MNLRSLQQLVRSDIEQFGVAKTVYDLALRAINRLVFLKIFKAMRLDVVNPDYQEANQRLQWQFFSKSQLQALAENPAHDITREFLREALEKGDECYGALDGQVLASYGWYSDKPTATSDDLTVHYSPEYIYMYKGFTHPDYRGKRLHAIGMNRALHEYLERHYKGLISYVESNNFSSLKSTRRLGYEDVGRVVVLRIGQHLWIRASRSCGKFGFSFAKTRPAAERALSRNDDDRCEATLAPVAESGESLDPAMANMDIGVSGGF